MTSPRRQGRLLGGAAVWGGQGGAEPRQPRQPRSLVTPPSPEAPWTVRAGFLCELTPRACGLSGPRASASSHGAPGVGRRSAGNASEAWISHRLRAQGSARWELGPGDRVSPHTHPHPHPRGLSRLTLAGDMAAPRGGPFLSRFRPLPKQDRRMLLLTESPGGNRRGVRGRTNLN